jgi:sulfatase maturation enzyme AslB (radical SAM superfamily)
MTKDALLKKLENMLHQAERERTWGQIEIELQGGEPTLLRRSSTEKLNDRENNRREQKTYR